MAILVCPLKLVPNVVVARRPDRVVSLLDPETAFPDCAALGVARHLRVGMHDINEISTYLLSPTEQHVQDVLAFISDWDRADPILVHCYAGISRSTATAFTIACALNPEWDEADIALTIRRASPSAWPNRRIVEIADGELGRGGRMVSAVAAIGNGQAWHEIGEAQPFEIPSRFGGPP